MSLRNDVYTVNNLKEESPAFTLARLPHYIICASLGCLSGIIGVALVMGLTVLAQLFLFQTSIVIPNAIALTVATVIAGCGAAWLMAQTGKWIVPSLAHNFTEQSWQVLFLFTILAALIEYPLFFYGM